MAAFIMKKRVVSALTCLGLFFLLLLLRYVGNIAGSEEPFDMQLGILELT